MPVSTQCSPLHDRDKAKGAKSVRRKSVQRHCKAKEKLAARRLRRKARDDLYSIDNVVLTSGRGKICDAAEGEDAFCQQTATLIPVPQFQIVSGAYYDEDKLGEGSEEMENDNKYEELHRPYELAEACHRFLNCGQGLPETFKGGLRIKLRLPKNSNELPSII